MKRMIAVFVLATVVAVLTVPAIALAAPGSMPGAAAADGLHNAYDKSDGKSMNSALYERFHGS